MKILLLNTYPHGGAGAACRRLQAALQESGHEVNMLTAEDLGRRWPFYAERLSFLPFEHDKSVRFSFSLANFGTDLSKHPLVQAADVIHLHWINQGFLSLQGIQALAALGKPIVWTLHDMWAFTGGCHYSRGCTGYLKACGNCPYLRFQGPNDLSHRIWARKLQLYPPNIQFVTCSGWLRDVALSSSLLSAYPVKAIPNPIDTNVFKPATDTERSTFRRELNIAPESRVLLFVAMKVSETRKGFHFLQEALQLLKQQEPARPIEIVVMGKSTPEALATLPYPVHALGMVAGAPALARVYGMADVFVIPSLEDNLPNTVMESLACGTPVAGFNTGGIPEMVDDGVCGFIAPQGDSVALAQAIARVLDADQASMRIATREKVVKAYSNKVVAVQYAALYQ
jgi:glycosyltransferase involved in cell wall biosynthesis